MEFEAVVFVMDLAGTAVFAVTGALAAMDKKLDMFGVIVLAVITALGGGTTRDILMGRMPPFYFKEYSYLLVAIVTALFVFPLRPAFERLWKPITVFDALGLGLFTALGAQKASAAGLSFVPVLILAMLTGVGGGILRDVLRGEIPFVLKKEIYASASLLGAVVFFILNRAPGVPQWMPLALCMIFTTAMRLLSVRFKLGLPTSG